mgnify:FL=1
MSKNVEESYAYYISGRNIQLYEIAYSGANEDVTYSVRLPEYKDQIKLKYPDETITSGLMFEGTAFIEPFVDIDPNELSGGNQPTLTEVTSPNEVSHINLNRMLSLACVDYVKGMLAERSNDINKKEYYMKEFFSKLADSESNKRKQVFIQPVNPFALR